MELFSIRPFRETDIDSAIELARNTGLSPWSRSGFHSHLESQESISLKLSHKNAEFAGFLVARFVPGADAERDAELLNIAVDIGFQGLRGGTILMRAFLKDCVETKAHRVWLDVRETNERAIQFYASFGFQTVQKRRAFYSNPVEDAIIMSLDLAQIFGT